MTVVNASSNPFFGSRPELWDRSSDEPIAPSGGRGQDAEGRPTYLMSRATCQSTPRRNRRDQIASRCMCRPVQDQDFEKLWPAERDAAQRVMASSGLPSVTIHGHSSSDVPRRVAPTRHGDRQSVTLLPCQLLLPVCWKKKCNIEASTKRRARCSILSRKWYKRWRRS